MKVRKFIAFILALLMLLPLTGCGSSGGNGNTKPKPGSDGASSGAASSDVTLEVAVNFTGDSLEVFQTICSDYMAQTGVSIVIDDYGADYSSTMTNRMANNHLPDVFVTASWTLRRYKEYLLPLTDEAYCKEYNESALGVIQDEDGTIYSCMLSCGVNGNVVNLDVCEAAGVDPYAIYTWDDFLAACAKIKAAGYTPIASNPDSGLTANPAGTFLTYENEVADVGAALLDGTWDWAEYRYVLEFYQKALSNGYFFEDARSINTNDMYERFASGKAAFIISENTGSIATCQTLNPNGRFIFAPFCASKEGGQEAITIGEGDSFSIWKDSKNIDVGKEFLRYLATSDVTLKLIGATSRISCIESTMAVDNTSGTASFRDTQEKYADHNIGYYNIWDRDYLPSGMWTYMGTAAKKMFADYSDEGIQKVIDYLKSSYDGLYKAE